MLYSSRMILGNNKHHHIRSGNDSLKHEPKSGGKKNLINFFMFKFLSYISIINSKPITNHVRVLQGSTHQGELRQVPFRKGA
jgi:hypothetical protein